MDAKALFKQLTCGINFAATKTNRKRTQPPIARPIIKKEKIEPMESDNDTEDDDDVDDNADQEQFPDSEEDDDADKDHKPIKTEAPASCDSADEANNLHIFGDIVAANRPTKKPKLPPTTDKLLQLEVQRINAIRNRHHLHVTAGGDAKSNARTAVAVPEPLETFAAMQQRYDLAAQLVANLLECGYRTPTPIQMQAIPMMCAGHSLLACAPTGSGKTATFLVPVVRALREPQSGGFRALVLCPTRELAKQTQRECLRLVEGIGLRVHTLGKTNQAESRYGAKSNGKFDVLVTTPNRVCHLLAQEPNALDLSNVQWLILDEADKLFEEGTNSFRDQFDRIHGACSLPALRVALFSATWTTPVARWLRRNVRTAHTVSVGQRNAATALVRQRLQFVGSEAGKLLAFRELVRTGLRPPVLVFVETRERAEQLHTALRFDGLNVDCIHADRTQAQRDATVKAFREGRVWVLICTELIGRGIDFKGVNLVVNYDFPPSPIAYIHRIGRTGRAGRPGEAITYFTQEDSVNLPPIARIANNSGCEVPAYMLAMKEKSKRTLRQLERERKPREAIDGAKKRGFASKKRMNGAAAAKGKGMGPAEAKKLADKLQKPKKKTGKTLAKPVANGKRKQKKSKPKGGD